LKNGARYRFFAYNSGTVIDTGMKFDTDVRRVVPETNLQELTDPSYISPPSWKMSAVRGFLAFNPVAVRQTGMKFYKNVPRLVPRTIILEERTNPSYITPAILENGDRYMFFCL
jgi:hypothetical protein